MIFLSSFSLEEGRISSQVSRRTELGPPIIFWNIKASYDRVNLIVLEDVAKEDTRKAIDPHDQVEEFFDSRLVVDELEKVGWRTRESNVLKGKSSASHLFSLVSELTPSTLSSTEKREFIVFDIVSMSDEVDSHAVLALFAKALDCDINYRAILAIPRLSEEAKKFARNYNIYFLEVEDVRNFSSDMKSLLNRVLQDRLKRATRRNSRQQVSTKRNSIDIMFDILAVVASLSSKSEIMACANLSYEQCQKYIPVLENLGLLEKFFEDGIRVRYLITEKGREYKNSMAGRYGRIDGTSESIRSMRASR